MDRMFIFISEGARCFGFCRLDWGFSIVILDFGYLIWIGELSAPGKELAHPSQEGKPRHPGLRRNFSQDHCPSSDFSFFLTVNPARRMAGAFA